MSNRPLDSGGHLIEGTRTAAAGGSEGPSAASREWPDGGAAAGAPDAFGRQTPRLATPRPPG